MGGPSHSTFVSRRESELTGVLAEGAGVSAKFGEGVEGAAPDHASTMESEDHGAKQGVEEQGCADGEGEQIKDGDAGEVTRGVTVGQSDHRERDQAGGSDGPRSEETGEGREEKQRQDDDAGNEGRGSKAEDGEEILGEVVGHAKCAGGPVDPDQVAAEDDLLAEALALDFESETEIFEDLQAEGFKAADGAIDGGADEVEATDADGIVFGSGVRGFPGTEGQEGEAAEDGGHQALAR